MIAQEIVNIIPHHGDFISSGHYTVLIKTHEFYNCNDMHVKAVQYQNIRNSASAYLLFYKKCGMKQTL